MESLREQRLHREKTLCSFRSSLGFPCYLLKRRWNGRPSIGYFDVGQASGKSVRTQIATQPNLNIDMATVLNIDSKIDSVDVDAIVPYI